MARLKGHYPALLPEDPEEWSRRVSAYAPRLSRYSRDVLELACERAAAHSPERFPTVGGIVEAARFSEERLKAKAFGERQHDREQQEAEATRAAVEHLRANVIPGDTWDQERWINEEPCPLKRLARRWEAESKRLNLDPLAESPRDVARRRIEEFKELWAAVSLGGESYRSIFSEKPEPGADG